MTGKTEDLGAPDPELKTSPVAWEGDEDTDTLREASGEEPHCLFNNRAFRDGTVVSSGGTRLRCVRGIWIPAEEP